MEKLKKEINIIKRKKLLIICIILIAIVLSICSTVYGRYVINRTSVLTFSTAPFYLEASADSNIKFDDGKATSNLIIKNNNGTQYNELATTYELSIENNNKFSFSVGGESAVNNKITKTINGGSKTDESMSVVFIADVNDLNATENLTLKIVSTEPFEKVIELPITISLYSVTVTLKDNSNGGTTVSPSTITVYKGKTYSNLPTPTWAGHTFNGWYTSSSGGTKITTSTTVTTTSSTQTLYAQWTSHLLADNVSVGDYVNYPISYANVSTNSSGTYIPADSYTGWRVISIEGSGNNKYVKLVTAGVPMTYVHPNASGAGAKSETALTTNFFSTAINSTSTNYTFRKCGFKNSSGTTITTISALKTLFNNETHTSSVQAMTKADLDSAWQVLTGGSATGNATYVTSTDLLAIPAKDVSSSYAAYHLATECEIATNYLWNVRYAGAVVYTNSEHGIRPVVTLKTSVETTGKSGTVWQLK